MYILGNNFNSEVRILDKPLSDSKSFDLSDGVKYICITYKTSWSIFGDLYDIYYKVFAADQLFIDISTISISTDHIVLILKYTPSFRASKTTAVMFALAYVAGQHFW